MTDAARVSIQGLKEFVAKLAQLGAIGDEIAMDGMEAGARIIQIYAQNNARTLLNRHPTGNLVNNIKVKREGKDVLVGVWNVVYAKIHEFGGTIVPIKAKALRFKTDRGWVQTKIVHMPARPYLRPALYEHLPEIERSVIATIRGRLGEICNG